MAGAYRAIAGGTHGMAGAATDPESGVADGVACTAADRRLPAAGGPAVAVDLAQSAADRRAMIDSPLRRLRDIPIRKAAARSPIADRERFFA